MSDYQEIDDAIKSGEDSTPNEGTGVMVKLFALKALRTRLAEKDKVIAGLVGALKVVKIRIAYIGHPAENFMDDGRPQWDHVIAKVEDALAAYEAKGGKG